METTERTELQKPRRVGTFTLGVVLVVSGGLMLASMFWPQLNWKWALKCSPLILIGLGVETLMAAKGGGKVKYDWLGCCCALFWSARRCVCTAWRGGCCTGRNMD